MKLSISNIAWDVEEDSYVIPLMKKYGVSGIEIAPTKIWDDPISTSHAEIQAYASTWNKQGIKVTSMQALLFGHPELTIFEDAKKRLQTISYLKKIIEICNSLGANKLVFGSPKNRLTNNLPTSTVNQIAADFFTDIGNTAIEYDCTFCIEPNPKDYGCDFINTSAQARKLVKMVNHPGFGLHLDAAGMTMSQEDIAKELPISIPGLCHFHISEENLNAIGSGNVNHRLFSRLFKASHYENWFSIEMRTANNGDNIQSIEESLNFVNKVY